MEHLAGLFNCPRALGFNTYALAWAAIRERTSTCLDSDQPVEIHQLSSDSDSQESQRPSSSELNYARHKVFLSHSGVQKPFVQKLFADLKAENHCPFYDEEESSLPKGENFVPLIFKAARHCRVAVVVLSEEFLTSKWPMIELVEFVKARKNDNKLKLLPLFYGLPVAATGDETNQRRWRAAWESFARTNDSESVQSMIEAFGELRRVNGLEFLRFESEKAYREAIVKTILGLSPSDLRFDTSKWEGCDRLCKVLSGMFRADIGSSGVQKLGLYGMGGVGKTTMSKALCNFFQQDYFGRVCHVELGSENALVLQKKVLKELAHLPEVELHQITHCDQGSTRLKKCLHQHPVFLVIDNVSDDQASREEARAYLEAGFHEGSKIMVTARSQEVVKGLLLDPKYCKQMPNLMKDEAAVIFLRQAAPGRKVSSLSPEEHSVLNSCLDQCYFDYNLNLDGASSSRKRKRPRRHYHSLALGALGAYYNTINDTELLAWKPRLGDDNKWKNTSAGDPPEIFRILGLQFSSFEEPTKLMFLDIALSFQNLTYFQFATPQRWITWLADIHEMSEAEVELKMNQLKRSAMISVGETAITTHDLYKEYAAWYVSSRGLAMSDVRFVYQTRPNQNNGLPRQLGRQTPGKCWPDLSRIFLRHLNCNEIPMRNLREWCNVVVLLLSDCSKVAVLNLYGLDCLRHLEISGLPKLETLIFTEVVCDTALLERQHSVCSLVSLKLVVLHGLPVLKRLPNFSPCLQLKELSISKCSTEVAASPCSCETAWDRPELLFDLAVTGRCLYRACLEDDSPSIPSCKSLQTLEMQWSRHYAHAMVFRNTLTSLRKLKISNPNNLASVRGEIAVNILLGLEYLTSLEEIYLADLPIQKLPGLERLTNLHSITLFNTYFVEELPHLGRLSRLRYLRLNALGRLDQIHGLDSLMHLEYLDLRDCCQLTWVADLRPLKNLQVVVLNGCDALEGIPPHTPKGCLVWTGPPPQFAFRRNLRTNLRGYPHQWN